MSRVAILGGSGFIGTRLVEHMQTQGADVVIGDKRKSESYPNIWQYCDVTMPDNLPEVLRGSDVIVNLAAEHRDDVRPVERYHNVNVHGAEVVCDVASRLGIDRLVFTSSVAVYGLHRDIVTEDHPCAPFNEYGRTKLLAERVYTSWWSAKTSRSLVIVRPTVVFGEGNRGNVYGLLQHIRSNRFVMVGEGKNRKSLAYVGNIAGFLAHTLTFPSGVHLFNYADAPDFDMKTLTSEVATRMGRKLPAFSIPYPAGYAVGAALDLAARLTKISFPLSAVRVTKFCANTQVSTQRALASGFRASVTLTEALSRVIQSDFPDNRDNGPLTALLSEDSPLREDCDSQALGPSHLAR